MRLEIFIPKKLFFIFASVFTLITSCSESFKSIDPSKFNKKIADRTDIETPEQLIRIYYDWPVNEGTPHLTIETEDLGNNKYKITLINDHMEDDALAAEKFIMTATRSGSKWTVLEIKENWKCWDGYGHSDWGIGSC